MPTTRKTSAPDAAFDPPKADKPAKPARKRAPRKPKTEPRVVERCATLGNGQRPEEASIPWPPGCSEANTTPAGPWQAVGGAAASGRGLVVWRRLYTVAH